MTELLAFRPVGTAFAKARKLLLEPFDLSVWAKLVIITFFVGGGTGSLNPGSNLQYSFDQSELRNLPHLALSDTAILALVLLVVALALALALIFMYLRGVFSFVLIDALATGDVRIRRPFRENMGRGFKAFGFELVVSLISGAAIVVIVLIAVLIFLGLLGAGAWETAINSSTPSIARLSSGSIILMILTAVIGIAIIVALSVARSLIIGFFYDFAVPLMRFKDAGLRQSIGMVLGLIKRQPLEFVVYVVVRWLLEIAIAIVLAIVFLFVFAVFFAVGLLAVIAMLEALKTSLLLALPFVLALLVGLALLIVITAIVSMPVQVYLRYYSLDFLRSFDPSFVKYSARFQ